MLLWDILGDMLQFHSNDFDGAKRLTWKAESCLMQLLSTRFELSGDPLFMKVRSEACSSQSLTYTSHHNICFLSEVKINTWNLKLILAQCVVVVSDMVLWCFWWLISE